MYSIAFETTSNTKEENVHWTRVIHIADNRKSSEVYGVPRMQTLFNRLYDLRKITGGSAEMFWKGGFPGYAFEMDPQAKALTTAQMDDLRDQITDFANGLQRYLRLQGIKVNSLDVQMADPKAHVDIQLEIIAIAMSVPKRIFMGAEQAKLASTKDTESWNKRIKKRQHKYLTPYVVREVIDRLIAFGVLPEPEKYDVEWPDLNTPSDADKADVLKTLTEALAKYMAANVDQLIPPEIFLKKFMGMNEDEIKEIMDMVEERVKEFEEEQAELNKEEEEDNDSNQKAEEEKKKNQQTN